jgi:hypothetical protein
MECYLSKLKLMKYIALLVLLLAVEYYCTTLPNLEARIVGWIGLVFFGSGLIWLPIRFFRTGPQVVVSHEGIYDRRLKVGVVFWGDVAAIYTRRIKTTEFLCLELRDPEKYLSRLPPWKRIVVAANRRLGFADLPIGFSGLTPGIRDVRNYLQDQGLEIHET